MMTNERGQSRRRGRTLRIEARSWMDSTRGSSKSCAEHCREQVQHKGIDVAAQLRDDKGHLVHHKPRDEMHVAGQPVELGYDNRAACLLRRLDRGGKLRAPIQGVGTLAALMLLECAGDLVAFRLGKRADGFDLRFEPQAAPGLPAAQAG
jgi:hypothetical protein